MGCAGGSSLATLEWVDWHNHRRLHSACHDLTPAEYELIHYVNTQHSPRLESQPPTRTLFASMQQCPAQRRADLADQHQPEVRGHPTHAKTWAMYAADVVLPVPPFEFVTASVITPTAPRPHGPDETGKRPRPPSTHPNRPATRPPSGRTRPAPHRLTLQAAEHGIPPG
jgi:hypothetical protein